MTDQPTCTAMVTHTGKLKPPPGGMQTGGPYVLCGAPVAAIGPCKGHRGLCLLIDEDDHNLNHSHEYEGALVHVALDGPCGECGHPALDEDGETTHWLSGVGPVCGECKSGELYEGNPLPGECVFVPTAVEVPSNHEAEVD